MPPARTSVSERARAFRRSPERARLVRYATVSVISTVLSLAMLYCFYRVVGLSPVWANIVATTIATIPSYYLNRTWAWGKSGKSHLMREVVPFWVISFVSLALSTGAVDFAARESHHISKAHEIETAFVLFANFFTYGCIWIVKFVLFNKVLFKRDPSESAPVVLVSGDVPADLSSTQSR